MATYDEYGNDVDRMKQYGQVDFEETESHKETGMSTRLKKGQLAILTSYSTIRENYRREYVAEGSCFTTMRYDLRTVTETESVRVTRIQRDGTIWYRPLSAEAKGFLGDYRRANHQTILGE